MIRVECIYLDSEDVTVFIKKRVAHENYSKVFSLYVSECWEDYKLNEKKVYFESRKELDNAFTSIVNSYKKRGFK